MQGGWFTLRRRLRTPAAGSIFNTTHLPPSFVHSPTLIILAALLSTMVTLVVIAVWHFNRHIPGLRVWVLAFLSSAVFSFNLLARYWFPEFVTVVVAQVSTALTGYLCWVGSRAYMRQPPPPHGVFALLLLVIVGSALFFTVVRPNPGVRFLLLGLLAGGSYLLAALTLAVGGFRRVPARYLLATIMVLHGAFVLVRPVVFAFPAALPLQPEGHEFLAAIASILVVEAIVAVVLIGFGTVTLTNEFTSDELRHLAEVDMLTNVYNRRAFLALLDKAISSAQRAHRPLPVLLLDLDHFKQINDTCGHQGGDDVLRHFVRLAQTCLRNEDVMGRLGGEEFGIFLPNADADGGMAVAERLCALVGASPVAVGMGRAVPVTVSIGVALAGEGDGTQEVLQRADEAMYLAKQSGRNCVRLAAMAPVASNGAVAINMTQPAKDPAREQPMRRTG